MKTFTELINGFNLERKGIIQLGAHTWQERKEFLKLGFKNFVLVEPLESAFSELCNIAKNTDANIVLLNIAVGLEKETCGMYVDHANKGMSSSLYAPEKHLDIYPDIDFIPSKLVEVWPLRRIHFDRKKYNILYMDIQGAELAALMGAEPLFYNYIDAIYTEVNYEEMYKNCGLFDELKQFLEIYDYTCVYDDNTIAQGWGNAFFVKNK